MKSNSQMARLTLAGLELGMTVALGAVGGMFLDRKFETSPWLMLGGLVLGVAAGFMNMYRLVAAIQKSDDERPGAS